VEAIDGPIGPCLDRRSGRLGKGLNAVDLAEVQAECASDSAQVDRDEGVKGKGRGRRGDGDSGTGRGQRAREVVCELDISLPDQQRRQRLTLVAFDDDDERVRRGVPWRAIAGQPEGIPVARLTRRGILVLGDAQMTREQGVGVPRRGRQRGTWRARGEEDLGLAGCEDGGQEEREGGEDASHAVAPGRPSSSLHCVRSLTVSARVGDIHACCSST
jgi:hypothetical protein